MTRLPPLDLLDPGTAPRHGQDLAAVAKLIARVAGEHSVTVEVSDWQAGPQATRYLVTPGVGVLPKRVEALTDALSVRIGAQVRYAGPLGTALGIEVPNMGDRDPVRLRSLIENGPALAGLGVAVGLAIDGEAISASLAKLPHLLVGGATGQGKSVLVNALLVSLLMRCTPEDLKLTLIDPKRVELKAYARLPHLNRAIVTDVSEAAEVLRDAAAEMDFRYERLEGAGVKDIGGWNDLGQGPKWARHVIVVDELADLMMTGGKGVEDAIVRLAQLGRAAGYHLILATQYPSAKVVTPLIKQNVPSRVALTTADHVASNLIVGCSGAEKLTGAGDALWSPVGSLSPVRVQGAFVTDDEVARVVAWWIEADRPRRDQAYILERLRAGREEAREAAAREHAAAADAAREAATEHAREVLAEAPASQPVDFREQGRVELVERLRREREDLIGRVTKLEAIVSDLVMAASLDNQKEALRG